MSVPTLYILSSKKVAQCMRNGKFNNIDIKFSSKISEQVLKELDVKKFGFGGEARALSISQKLLLTKLVLGKRNGVSHDDILFLSKQEHLVSLELGPFRHFSGRELDSQEYIDELKKCISERSRKTLRHLGLSTGESTTNFVPKLYRMFPNLTSLNLHDSLINIFDLIAIYKNYPNLTQLDIYMHRQFNVQGISKLRHLEHLSIGCARLESCHGLEELCQMTSLRVLDLSDENNRDTRLFEEILRFLKPGSLSNLEVLDLSGNMVTLRKYQKVLKALESLRVIVLLATPLAFEDLSSSAPKVLNCANFQLLHESFHFLRGKENRIRIMFQDVMRSTQYATLELRDVKLKNAFIRDICEMLIDSGAGSKCDISIWLVSFQAINLLISYHFFPTAREVKAVCSIYFTFKDGFPNEFCRNTDIHHVFWRMMRDLCVRRTFLECADPKLVKEAIRSLANADIQPRAVDYVLDFFQAGYQYYPLEYTRFLSYVRGVAIESNDFCRNYTKFNLVEKFFFRLNLPPTNVRVRLAHLKILKLVVLNMRQMPEIRSFCASNVVAHLLSYITPGTLTLLGHYAFAILWTLQYHHKFADRRQSLEFDEVKKRKPLDANIVWDIIDHPEEMELIHWAPPDSDAF